MNVREGMRRLGLVAGFLGASAGAVVAYIQLQPLLARRAQYRTFQTLVSSPVVQKKIESLNDPFDEFGGYMVSAEINQGGIKTIYFRPHRIPSFEEFKKQFKKQGGTPTAKASFSAADVSEIETDDSKTVDRTEPVALWSYLFIPVFPVLGFFLPWGAIKTFMWIGLGFSTSGKRERPRAEE
jgi:hypothetical protein